LKPCYRGAPHLHISHCLLFQSENIVKENKNLCFHISCSWDFSWSYYNIFFVVVKSQNFIKKMEINVESLNEVSNTEGEREYLLQQVYKDETYINIC
jgi:hypothetical protein